MAFYTEDTFNLNKINLKLISGKSDSDTNWSKPSLAVIANNGGQGIVLWTAGPHLKQEIDDCGNRLDELGLDDAPEGISIWEGSYGWQPGSYEYPEDGSSYPNGTFRDPTPEEWLHICMGNCPWDPALWSKDALDNS